MNKVKKHEVVEQLTAEFTKDSSIFVCDYKGSKTKDLETLRNAVRDAEGKVQVVKNNLAKIALANNGIEANYEENNIFIWGEDQIATCKVADKSAIANKDNFSIKAGVIESKVADLATIEAMAKLPGRDELLGMLLNVWNAPVQNFTIGMSALAKKLEEEA